jgi:MFS family permease
MIQVFNLIIILSSGICLIHNDKVLIAGRFLFGLSAGAMTLFVPKFINETSPMEYKGTFGVVAQLACVCGLLTAIIVGYPYPEKQELKDYDGTEFVILYYYRIALGMPIVFALIQMLLLVSIFRYDTPLALKQQGNWEDLTALLSKMYIKSQVTKRIAELDTGDKKSADAPR